MIPLMNPHLKQFARQLKDWSQVIVEHGRTPFRRVDCYTEIDTEAGILEVPLLFWINKQSLMAGGFILLPEQDLEGELQRGRCIATALGLSHFVTWETTQVRLWYINGDRIQEQQVFPLPGTDHPDYFRILLNEIIDGLKVPAITGAIAAEQLSHYYFHNLFRVTLESAQPALTQAYRSQRAESQDSPIIAIDELAKEANQLLLLQILTTYWLKLLPDTLLPEQFHETITIALKRIDTPCGINLDYQWESAPDLIPLETGVCYHHLLLRLHQLNWRQPPERMQKSVQRAIEAWYFSSRNLPTAEIMIHPEAPTAAPETRVLLSSSPLILATTTLIRSMEERPQPCIIYGSTFQLDRDDLTDGTISAQLLNAAPISRTEKSALSARLRISWPHRLLRVSTDQPYWKWELIHLLGLCQHHQQLHIEIPLNALNETTNDPLWMILGEHYRITSIHYLPGQGRLQLLLVRSLQQDCPIRILQGQRSSEILPEQSGSAIRAQILRALIHPAVSEPVSSTRIKPATESENAVRYGVIEQLTTYGIPSFPEQYLYFLEDPQMVSYKITPPLQQQSSILGQFELKDASGQIIHGYGEELEQSLLLCSQAGKTSFELPANRHQLETMLQHYRKDLNALYRHLSDICYREFETTDSARKLIKKTWKKLHLPDPTWFKN